jgi:hypothetical protein
LVDNYCISFFGPEAFEKQIFADFISFVYSADIAVCFHICDLSIFLGMASGDDTGQIDSAYGTCNIAYPDVFIAGERKYPMNNRFSPPNEHIELHSAIYILTPR